MISRRRFISLLGGAAAAQPVAAQAQQPAMPVIGVLNVGTSEQFARLMLAFRQGLAEIGYVEGRNVAMEYRWAGSRNDRFSVLAADLVRSNPTVITSSADSFGTSRQGRGLDDSDSLLHGGRSGPIRTGRQPQPTWR